MTLLGELAIQEPQLRVVDVDGRRALETVRGLTATAAIAKLRFGPGQTCEPVARLIETAVARAERAGVGPDQMVVIGGEVERAEDIIRVRRKAHGKADWPTATVPKSSALGVTSHEGNCVAEPVTWIALHAALPRNSRQL